jgi:tripartite motif-containing protein 2/3/tripartite motif-containing protein 71
VVAIEQLEQKVKQLDAVKKVTLYCSLHQGKELELYCETCEELICHNCTINKHYRPKHKFDRVEDTVEKHKAEIRASLEPIKIQMDSINKALEQLNLRSLELDDLQITLEDSIHQQIQEFQELLEARKVELISQLQQYIQTKKKNLAAQKDELETVHIQLASCISFVRESLRTGSQGEVMKMKKAVVKQIKEMTDNFEPDTLPPCELANVEFIASFNLIETCREFEVYLQKASPEKCHAVGRGLEFAEVGKRAFAVLDVVDQNGKTCITTVETLTCEFVSVSTGEKIDCSIKKTETSQYEISYLATSRGRHQLHIKVGGGHIKESPFPVNVKLPVQKLGTPIKSIQGVQGPWGVAINQRGEIIIAEYSGFRVSIFSQSEEKLLSFGPQFNYPQGVAVDECGNILVVEKGSYRIQKFTSAGMFINAVGKKGNKLLEFNYPLDIAIHPLNKMVYVSDRSNHRVQILNPDLTSTSSFGSFGSESGKFHWPWGVTFDHTGNVYIADSGNHRIQVFTAEREFLREFGKYGRGNGELNFPASICIDSCDVLYVSEWSNHRVSVFTCEGKFLTSFGTKGVGPGQFKNPCGIALDMNGIIYISDYDNNRLQLF